MLDKILVILFLSVALAVIALEFVVRAQVNRHLSPGEQVGIFELKRVSAWLGRNGLIARHKRLYPKSWLADTFRVVWVLFFGIFLGLVV